MSKQKPKPFSSWFPLLVLYVAYFAWGATTSFTLNGAVYWVYSLLLASMAAMWVVFDAQHRGKPLVNIVQFLIMGTWPIAVPIYLISTRGIRGIGWSILNAVCLLATNISGYYLAVLGFWGPESLWPQI